MAHCVLSATSTTDKIHHQRYFPGTFPTPSHAACRLAKRYVATKSKLHQKRATMEIGTPMMDAQTNAA
jgi:hypothetical protein